MGRERRLLQAPKSGLILNSGDLLKHYEELVVNYPIVSIEDGMGEDDIQSHSLMTKSLVLQTVGDDLFVTNPERIRMGVLNHAANAVLIKPNQIGTVSETLNAMKTPEDMGLSCIVSIAPEIRRIPLSQTSWRQPAAAKSRPVLPRAPKERLNITGYCLSSRSSANTQNLPEALRLKICLRSNEAVFYA